MILGSFIAVLAFEYSAYPQPRTVTLPANYEVPRSYALVVGISDYKHLPSSGPEQATSGEKVEFVDLKFAHRDAEFIYRELISPTAGNFPAENVQLLTGPSATLANLRWNLEEWLPSVAKKKDRVLIYFGGHGLLGSDGKSYLAPYDLDPHNVASTGYAMETLSRLVSGKIVAKDKVLLTDACRSGSVTPVNRGLRSLDRSLFSLTASRENEQSFENELWGGGHGIFTYCVVKALQGEADNDRDGIITAAELASYVSQNVRERTNGKQNPAWAKGAFDPAMHLAYVPERWRPGDRGSLTFEANTDDVQVFVDDSPIGIVNGDALLRREGLSPGPHVIKAAKHGYQPDGPRQVLVYPRQEASVKINIVYAEMGRKQPAGQQPAGWSSSEVASSESERQALEMKPIRQLATVIFEANMDDVQVFVDGKFEGVVRKDTALTLLGLLPGARTVMAVKTGYRPVGPREEVLSPGDEKYIQFEIRDKALPQGRAQAHLDRCLREYAEQNDYKKAVDACQRALKEDPKYGEAALYLGRTYRGLKDYKNSEKYVRDAIRIKGEYDEARVTLAGLLLDTGRFDEALRELTDVAQRQPSALVYALLAQTYRLKGAYVNSIQAARKALEINSKNPQAHLYLAEALRIRWDEEKNEQGLLEAIRQYEAYIKLTDFESRLAAKIFNYWTRGLLIGGGRKTRSTLEETWKMLRALAYFGMGDSERLLKRPDSAIEYYRKSLEFDEKDPLVHYGLGIALMMKPGKDYLRQAEVHFNEMLRLNPNLIEAPSARQYLLEIAKMKGK